MTTNFADSAFPQSPTRWRATAFAMISIIALGTAISPVLAGGWKDGANRNAVHERGANASSPQGIGIGGGGGLILGRGFLRGILREFIGNLARGGPGEGATPHISPTDDWKGQ